MSNQQFEQLDKSLKSIDEKLEILIILLKRGLPRPSVGEEEKKVLALCDRKHIIGDIAKQTNKTENNVKVMLTRLRDKGLIRSIDLNGVIAYERI
jgi:DNA-binding MarR family transcriptional regulator